MELISNIIERSKNAVCYITIFDEHFAKNLITIYGQEKAVSIILNGKKYDNKYHVIAIYAKLICVFEFHPTRGLLMKAYDFNHMIVHSNDDSFKKYLKKNNLTNHIKDINAIKTNPTHKLKIKTITPEEYLFDKLK